MLKKSEILCKAGKIYAKCREVKREVWRYQKSTVGVV